MTSAQPVSMADGQFSLGGKVAAFIASAKELAKDGMTWMEFGELLVALLRICIATLDTVATLTGAEKKTLALEAVGALFDSLADCCVPMAWYPIWLVVRPSVRSLILALSSGAIEVLLPMVRA